MLTSSDSINSEEFIFFIDIITDFLKKKSLMKAIKTFIKEKNKFNALSSYGIVIFQKDENPINEYDIKDSDVLLDAIDDAWDTRETEQSYLENGLYEILAYIFRKSRDTRKNYRVIIISDTPSRLTEDYYNALYDLLIKAKKFSAFIDVIRVGNKKFYEDDVKLKVISSETHGGMFYCQDEKLLQNILGSLIQNKKEFNVLKKDDIINVLIEDKVFYERLAVDLISLSPEDEEICTICEQELCPICGVYSDEIHKCFNCSAKFHSCCAAKYALAKNIGFRHIYRCPQCETLLKIDEEFVKMVYEEEMEEEYPELEKQQEIVPQPEKLKGEQEKIEEETVLEEEIEQEIDIEELTPPNSTQETIKKIKVGGFFGKEIEIKLKKDLETKTESQLPSEKSQKPISITTLKPPSNRETASIKLCKICGATLQNATSCPMCGAKIE